MAVPVAPFAAVVHRQKRIVASFQGAGATTASQPVTPASLGIEEGLAFRILLRHGVLHDAGEHRFWLDPTKWEGHRRRRRRLAILLPAIALTCCVLTMAAVWLVRA